MEKLSLRGAKRRNNPSRFSLDVKDCFVTLAMTGAALFLLSSCATKQVPPQTAKPWIPQQQLYSISGLADVDIKVRGRTRSFQAALIAEHPNRLRIIILDDLGREQATLVANGREVMWVNRRDGVETIFPQDPDSLKKTLRLPMELEEFVAHLLQGNSSDAAPSSSRYQIFTEDLEATPQGPYPRQWTWNFRKPKAVLSFLFSQVKLNSPLEPGRFDF